VIELVPLRFREKPNGQSGVACGSAAGEASGEDGAVIGGLSSLSLRDQRGRAERVRGSGGASRIDQLNAGSLEVSKIEGRDRESVGECGRGDKAVFDRHRSAGCAQVGE